MPWRGCSLVLLYALWGCAAPPAEDAPLPVGPALLATECEVEHEHVEECVCPINRVTQQLHRIEVELAEIQALAVKETGRPSSVRAASSAE
jgi:hypothetical protein